MKLTKYTSLSAAIMMFSSVAYSATDYQELSEELEIVSSVLHTSLKQDTQDQGIKFRAMQTSYLANQGVVFTVSTSGQASRFFISKGDFTSITLPSAPPAPPLPPRLDLDGNHISTDMQHTIDEAMASVRHLFDESSDKLRQVQSEVRALSWQVRDAQRQQRDLDFEMRGASESRKNEIKLASSELEKKLAKLKQEQASLQEYSLQLQNEHKAALAEKTAKREEKQKGFLAAFEEGVVDSLCRFGGGIRAIPNSENISFVLSDFNQSTKASDKIYVFKVSDIKKCVQEKLKPAQLLSAAKVYDF